MGITISDKLREMYGGSELLITRKVQAFCLSLSAITAATLLYIGIALFFSFSNSREITILIHFLLALSFAFYILFRGKYDVALLVSFLTIIIPLIQISFLEQPLTEHTVYFVTMILSTSVLFLTLLAPRTSQLILESILSMITLCSFFLFRIYLPMEKIPIGYSRNFLAALLILLSENIMGYLIHSLIYSTLREIKHQMDYDGMTGLPNKNSMTKALKKIHHLDKYMILIFYRIENLNELRLRLGDSTTVSLIRETASLLETEHQNSCYHVTGNTLAVIRKDPMLPVKMEVDRIINNLKTPLTIGELSVQVFLRACMTKTTERPGDPNKLIDKGLRGLEKALIEHKKRILFTDEEEEQIQRHMDLVHELGSSLLEGSCRPVYQAIYDRDGEVSAFEALTRWTRQDGTAIAPDEFIPFLEQSGLMADFFFRMFLKNLDDIIAWPSFFQGQRVFINLSPEIINDGFDFERMVRLMDDRKVSRERIGFEVTETTILKDRKESIHLIEKLRDNGFTIALDDFGTGYSNITQILELPIQKIKFDKSFIHGILSEPQKRDLCAVLMGHFHKYDYITIAEGVEKEEQLALLKSLGCRQYQGYLLARPVRPENAEENFQLKNLARSPV